MENLTKAQIENSNGTLIVDGWLAAEICGVGVATLHRWARDANPPPKLADGRYDLKALGAWCRTEQVKKTFKGKYLYAPAGWGPMTTRGKTADSDDPVAIEDKNTAETRLKTAQADKVEMENDVASGKLVPVDEVATAWQMILSRVRTRLLKIPSAVAPLVLGDPKLYSIQQKLKDAVSDALAEASVDWQDQENDGVEDDE